MEHLTLFTTVCIVLVVHLMGWPGLAHGAETEPAQLKRVAYTSTCDHAEREFFLHLPAGYTTEADKTWPVIVFLHGDGERGDTKEDLDYLLKNGPLYEAWIQKRDLPFIIIAPQLGLFDRNKPGNGPEYLVKRTRAEIPQRLEEGVPAHTPDWSGRQIAGPMQGAATAKKVRPLDGSIAKTTWDKADPDVITILHSVLTNYRADARRAYLTGVSLGGFGAWYFASQYPEKFAALCPVVGYGTVEQAEAIANAKIPIWVFSGGRDPVVQTQYFFPAMNKLDELGAELRFTTEQDMAHDVWNRVYAGEDVYQWLLHYQKE